MDISTSTPAPAQQARAILRDTHARWLILLVTFVGYLGALFLSPHPEGMTITNGDEPHYLLLAHSLYVDQDFDPINNYVQEDWQRFYDAPVLDTHLSGFRGRLVPHHQMPGLPFFIFPAYVLAGRIGVLLFLSLCMAAAIRFLYTACRAYVRQEVALGVCLLLGLTYPIIIFSQQIYPDPVAFVLVSLALAQILAPPTSGDVRWRALLCATALAYVPLLHYKMAPISVVLFLFFLWRHRAQVGQAIRWSLAPILFFITLMVAWFLYLFGEISIEIFRTQTHYHALFAEHAGVAGLFFDQAHGLMFFAPIYMLAFLGVWVGLRDPQTRIDSIFLVLAYLPYHLLMGTWQDWIGGGSATARYLIPILPILVIFVARAVEHLRARQQWLHMLVLAGLSLWLTLQVLQYRLLMFGHGQTVSPFLHVPLRMPELAVWFPTFMNDTLHESYGRLVLLLVLFLVFWYILSLINHLLIRVLQRS
jgi:hypothetical protein